MPSSDAAPPPPRKSVFDRLGPVPAAHDDTVKNSVRHGNENRAPHEARSGGAKPTAAPRGLQPNALLHRSLQEVRKERASEAMTAPGAANVALQARVADLEARLAASDDLGNALLLGQQSLLTEKARLQAENAQLTREAAALRERLDFLHFSMAGGGGAAAAAEPAAEPHAVASPQPLQGPPPTPDSVAAMLRVLRTAELGMDSDAVGGADPAHLVSYAARVVS